MNRTCKVFLDTQVCINAAAGQIKESDWESAIRYVQETAEYCVSAPTLGEVLTSIAKSDARYFEQRKERLRRLCPSGGRFFDFPEYFLASTLGFQLQRPPNLDSNLGFDVSVILWAESKDDLSTGVPLPFGGFAIVRFGKFLTEMESSKQTYVSWFETLKGTKKPEFSAAEWASNVLKAWGVSADTGSCTKFVDALPAAYEYELSLHDLVRNSNYDIRKHVTDLVDARQLIYLCDPEVVFVTDDTDFKKRLRKNPQINRILTFPDLVDRARDGRPILQSA